MSRASALIVATLGAASAVGEAQVCTPNSGGGGLVCARDSAMLQARATVSHSPHEGHVTVEHQMVGCFPRATGDTDDQGSFEDPTCVSAASRNSSLEPCRSGMPFFRLPMQPQQSYLDCFTFCLSKGLDLSGLVHSELAGLSECRCGATRANKAAWHGLTPPLGLLLPDGSAVPEDSEHCKMVVWQYTGPLENEAVPTALTELSVSDEAYIDGIAVGVDPHQIMEEDAPESGIPTVDPDALSNLSNLSLLGTKGVCEDHAGGVNNQPCSQVKAWCNDAGQTGLTVRGTCPLSCGICSQLWGWMSCYPNACGPGGGPWTTKQGNTVYINYFYDNLDSNRRAAFEKAKDEWESKTCVKFTYNTATPRMRITVTNKKTCSAFVGFPGSDGTLDVNLGWCNNVDHWGNIAHELGHALGMNHEQNRPDGAGRINTPTGVKGNYLAVKWNNIDAAWRPQWVGERRSYYGSQTAGYAEYDYGSMMHYALGDDADATNPAFQSVPGQRSGLSESDIRQFQDMYQCRAPAPAPTPGPAPAGCEDYDVPFGQSCAMWKARGDCATSQGIRDYCKVSCQECTPPTPAPTPEPACTDTPGQLSYGLSCVEWAVRGDCPGSQALQRDCPGSCAEASKVVHSLTCADWQKRGDCPGSKGLKRDCPHLCGKCRSTPATVPAPAPAPTPAATTKPACTDTREQLSYGKSCVEWALGGHCSRSQTLQKDCPGSCAEFDKVVHSLTCAAWQKRGDCPGSKGLKRDCPHLCGKCR